jgi:hypothetical protein
MGSWGFWDWVGYSGFFIAAAIISLNQALSSTTNLKEWAAPILRSGWWSHVPLTFMILATLVLILAPSEPPASSVGTSSPGSKSQPLSSALVGFGPEYLLELVQNKTAEEREVLINLYKGRTMRATGAFASAARQSPPRHDEEKATVWLNVGASPPRVGGSVCCHWRLNENSADAPAQYHYCDCCRTD